MRNFNEMYAQHKNILHYYTRREVYKNKHLEYDDVFQEMLITLWKCCEAFDDGKSAKFSSYLISAVIHRLINHRNLCKNKQRKNEVHPERFPVPKVYQHHREHNISRAMQKLNPRLKMIVSRVSAGEQYQELSGELNISWQRVQQLHTKAIRDLRKELVK